MCLKSIVKKISIVIFVWFLYEFIQRISIYLSDVLVVCFQRMDPSNAYSWNYLHHFNQLVLALLIISIAIWNKSYRDWGFNLNSLNLIKKIIIKFGIGWFLIYGAGTLIFTFVIMKSSKLTSLLPNQLTNENLIANFIFMIVLVGISEEILFRGLVMGILRNFYEGELNILGIKISSAGFITAVIFSLAHIGFSYYPFEIYYLQPIQCLLAFGLGIFYGILFDKSKSLLGPILAHNLSDGLGYVIIYLVTLLVL